MPRNYESADQDRMRPGISMMYLKIAGRMSYLWRAVDADGEVLDALVQSKRNKPAALKLIRKLLKKIRLRPRTDDDRQTPALRRAARELRRQPAGEQSRREFAPADPSKRARDAALQEPDLAQRFLSTHAAVYNVVNVQCHLSSRPTHRVLRSEATKIRREAPTAA